MSQDKELTKKKLDDLWGNNQVQALDIDGKKYVIVSDIHMGDGGGADDFRENEKTLEFALESYRAENYTLILLGDVEEFWQFDLEQIAKKYLNTIYAKIKAFGDDRVIRVFGNHDSEWGCPVDPSTNTPNRHQCAAEAIKMRINSNAAPSVLLVHGHQGSTDADKNSWFSRFVVRGLFKPLEPFAKWAGLYGHPSATKSQVTVEYERVLYSWAKDRKVILICGHSHRAIFASRSYADELQEQIAELQAKIHANRAKKDLVKDNLRKIEKIHKTLMEERLKNRDIDPTEPDGGEIQPCYFNSGCALYSDGITTIEIDQGQIRLVKWSKDATINPRFKVLKSEDLIAYIQKVTA